MMTPLEHVIQAEKLFSHTENNPVYHAKAEGRNVKSFHGKLWHQARLRGNDWSYQRGNDEVIIKKKGAK
jgi:hypothetical protein